MFIAILSNQKRNFPTKDFAVCVDNKDKKIRKDFYIFV